MEALTAAIGGISPWTLLIICPMLFLAGFVDAIGGGGGLISLPAYLLAGLPAHLAMGTNKLSSAMGTLISTLRYVRCGYMEWRLCGYCAVAALVGAFLGSRLQLVCDERVLLVFMLVSLPVVGFYVFKKKDFEVREPAFDRRKTVALAMAIALGCGFYDGFYGPGAGTFMLLLLNGVARLDIYHSAGTTKIINLTTNVTSLAVFLTGGTVIVILGLIGGLFNIAGSYTGARLFSERGSTIVRPIILVVLVVFAIRLVLQLLGIV